VAAWIFTRHRILMRDGRLLTLDVAAIADELGALLPALTERRQGRRIQDYDG
jgi:5-methylthioadenosine/S-adenosylhomocysteine deaminase